MNGRLFSVYFLGFLLLFYSSREAPTANWSQEKVSPFTLNQLPKIRSAFQDRSHAYLLNAFITGNKKSLNKKIKNDFQILSLAHLFTPSGIHLSSLYLLLIPLVRRLKNKLFFFIPLLGLAYFFTPFHSIKRILLIRTTKEWLKTKNMFTLFIFSFLWDFTLGTYHLSPLSFSYSFLFLGIILSFENSPKLLLPLALFGGQIISQYVSIYPLTTTGFFWNFLLTSLFSLLYPFYFLAYLLPTIPFAELSITAFLKIVEYSSTFAISMGTFIPTFNLVLVCFYLSLGKRKLTMLIPLLYFSSTPLLNSELKYIKSPSSKGAAYQMIKRTKAGYTTWHSDRLCRHRHNLYQMTIKCQY